MQEVGANLQRNVCISLLTMFQTLKV